MMEKNASYEEALGQLSEIFTLLQDYDSSSHFMIFMIGLATAARADDMTNGEAIGAFARFLDDFEITADEQEA
jgi:hypothetical protein